MKTVKEVSEITGVKKARILKKLMPYYLALCSLPTVFGNLLP